MTNSVAPIQTSPSTTGKNSPAVFVLLIAILIMAAALRLVGLNWDQGYHLHPDERFLSDVTSSLTPVSSIAEYFDTQNSTLNPNNIAGGKFGFYVYGDFPIILTRYVSGWLDMSSYYSNYLVGRGMSTTADLLTVLTVFLIGWEIFDQRLGLLAAAFYAAAALPIQQSHFYTVDTFTTLFVTAAFYFAARLMNRHRWLDYALFGVMLGLAMSSKVSIFPFAIVLILALVVRVLRDRPTLAETPLEESQVGMQQAQWINAIIGLVLAGIITIVVFRIGQPYAFLPPNSDTPMDTAQLGAVMTQISRIGDPIGLRPNPLWLAQMSEVRRQVSGQVDFPPNHQWAHQPKIIFPLMNIVRIGLGWPLGVWCWLAFAWAVWEIVHRRHSSLKLLPLVAWIALYFTWQGIGWVMSMRYFLPIYPFLVLLGAWAVFTAWDRVQRLITERGASRWHLAAKVVAALGAVLVICAFAWGFAVSRIYAQPMTRIAASEWVVKNIPSDVTLHLESMGDQPDTFQLGLLNEWPARVPTDQEDPTEPQAYYTEVADGAPRAFAFQLPYSASLTSIRFNHIVDPSHSGLYRLLTVTISTTPDTSGALATSQIAEAFTTERDPRGSGYQVAVPSIALNADQQYWLILEPDSTGSLVFAGSTVTTEGDWDDPIPLNVPGYNIWDAQFHAYELQMAWEDEQPKRERLEYILNHTDYITISSNRFYGTLPRNPNRFPLSIEYYKALFSGELGFELIKDFTARPTLGPFEFFDDTAEEAWTVYDHPRVLIFRKTPHYDPQRTAEILDRADLTQVQKIIASQAGGRPITLIPPSIGDQPLLPRSTGYNIEAALPSSEVPITDFWVAFQPLAVAVWWLVIGAMGWAAMPILYTLFPGLADRGVGISRIFSLLLVAWSAWLLASLNILAWGSPSILLMLAVVAAIGAALIYPRRREFFDWLRTNSGHILFTELTLLALFLFFLLVRLGNPDLWHLNFGGEKPMDLSYFNAVLNTQSFPPYDPWFAGGTINYYYFGFVIVGVPVKLLGMPSTLAYNLILPTLFAVTGYAAFSAAYNLLAPDSRSPVEESATQENLESEQPNLWQVLSAWPKVSGGEIFDAWGRTMQGSGGQKVRRAYLAGCAAMLLSVLLGNLDQIRTIFWGLAELGAGEAFWTMTLLPRIEYMTKGIEMLSNGALLPVGMGDWYWNATRLIPVPIGDNIPLEQGPITEFPYFTFLYADLHAHMMSLSLTLMAVIWAIAQIRDADQEQRNGWMRLLWWTGNLLVGGLIIGALRPTNTWDWPTYLAIGAAALIIAQIGRRHDRAAYPALAIGGLFAVASGAAMYQFNSPLAQQSPDAAGSVIMLAGISALVGFVLGYGITLLFTTMRKPTVNEGTQPSFLYSWVTLILAGIQAAVLAGLTTLLYLPYIRNYTLGYTSAIPWTGSKTPVWAYLDIHGLFLFLIVTWLIYESVKWWRETNQNSVRQSKMIVLAAVVIGASVLIASVEIKIAVIALPLIVWSMVLFLRPDQQPLKRLTLVMLMIAIALSLVVELVVLQGDISRMNTVFKFYLQIWILYAIVAGAAFGWVWPRVMETQSALRWPWLTVFAVLVFMAALYPITATRAKISDRWNPDAPHTLDGMDYMQHVNYTAYSTSQQTVVAFPLKSDYEALRWLQENVEGAPVILEAQEIREYLWGSRVAVYTGFPSVVGWNWHQRQQRGWQADEVWNRVNMVNSVYDTADIPFALNFIQTYRVDLIFVGELEKARYSPAGIAKFEQMEAMGYLRLIYERDGTRIYEVIDSQVAGS